MSKFNFLTAGLMAAPLVLQPTAALADEGDGAPHLAVVDDAGNLELEFEIDFGLDNTTDPPTINLATLAYDNVLGGYRTFAVNDTPTPNDDLGFVSEVEDPNGSFSGDIVVRMLSKDANFTTFFESAEIFTLADPDFELGSSFDTHPIWVLSNDEGDFTSASALFEVFDVTLGDIGSGAESLGQFQVNLAVPEPTTAGLLGVAGLTLLARRRRK